MDWCVHHSLLTSAQVHMCPITPLTPSLTIQMPNVDWYVGMMCVYAHRCWSARDTTYATVLQVLCGEANMRGGEANMRGFPLCPRQQASPLRAKISAARQLQTSRNARVSLQHSPDISPLCVRSDMFSLSHSVTLLGLSGRQWAWSSPALPYLG